MAHSLTLKEVELEWIQGHYTKVLLPGRQKDSKSPLNADFNANLLEASHQSTKVGYSLKVAPKFRGFQKMMLHL